MSDTVIDRDEQQQRAFGDALVNFESDMRSCCQALRAHIEDARDNIQADNAAAALDNLIELIESIESELPGVAEFGELQKKLAMRIEEGSNYRFSRH
jgi:hypothetical protein